MFSIALLSIVTLGGLKSLTTANPVPQQITSNLTLPQQIAPNLNVPGQITPNLNVPAGYQVGFATQDWEPSGQQSACTTGGNVCSAPTPLFPSTAGPAQMPAGVYAAAIVGLGPNDCSVCGTCYSIISSGTPYCAPNGPGCAVPSGPVVQSGPSEIKVLITNHCPDCTMINVDGQVQGRFDINNAPYGWDNPKIYYMQVDNSECY